MIILLLGPHGAGKTTLGRALSKHCGWAFHEELGKTLANDPTFRPPSVRACELQPTFDREVFAREMERDFLFDAVQREQVRIVETWHPGNFGYAALRSPEVALAMGPYLRERINWSKVVVVPVSATAETLKARKTCPESSTFFLEVARLSLEVSLVFGARQVPQVQTDSTPPADLAARLAPRLAGIGRAMRRRGAVVLPTLLM